MKYLARFLLIHPAIALASVLSYVAFLLWVTFVIFESGNTLGSICFALVMTLNCLAVCKPLALEVEQQKSTED